MPEQKLDLFEIATGLAAELGAGTAEIVSTEALKSQSPWLIVPPPTTRPSRSAPSQGAGRPCGSIAVAGLSQFKLLLSSCRCPA